MQMLSTRYSISNYFLSSSHLSSEIFWYSCNLYLKYATLWSAEVITKSFLSFLNRISNLSVVFLVSKVYESFPMEHSPKTS